MFFGRQIQNPAIQVAAGWCAVLGLIVFSYWNLITFDPQEGIFRPAEGVEGIFFEPTGQTPLPILALVVWMVWRRRAHLTGRTDAGAASLAVDIACFIAAAVITAWSTHVGAPDLLVFSLQLVLLGAGGSLGGEKGRRAMLLPALALLLAIPIPPVVLNRLIFGLQLWTASTCSAISQLLGQSAEVVGVDIITSRAVFRVIEACTGIRMTSTLFMATILYSELSDRTAARCIVLLLWVPVVGTVINLVRVLAIMGNPYSEIAGVHSAQGILMMVVAVLLIVGIDIVLEKIVPAAHAFHQPAELGDFRLGHRYIRVLGASVVLAVVVFATPRFQSAETANSAILGDLPRILFNQRSDGLSTDIRFLGSVAFTDRFDRGYGDEAERVRVFAGENDRSNRRGSVLSEKTSYPGSGWRRLGTEKVQIESGVEADLLTFISVEGRRQELHWREGVGSFWFEMIHNFLGLDQSLFASRSGPARVFRVGIDLPRSAPDRRERLLAYARAVRSPDFSSQNSDSNSSELIPKTGKQLGN